MRQECPDNQSLATSTFTSRNETIPASTIRISPTTMAQPEAGPHDRIASDGTMGLSGIPTHSEGASVVDESRRCTCGSFQVCIRPISAFVDSVVTHLPDKCEKADVLSNSQSAHTSSRSLRGYLRNFWGDPNRGLLNASITVSRATGLWIPKSEEADHRKGVFYGRRSSAALSYAIRKGQPSCMIQGAHVSSSDTRPQDQS
jgi:hypothetical protein